MRRSPEISKSAFYFGCKRACPLAWYLARTLLPIHPRIGFHHRGPETGEGAFCVKSQDLLDLVHKVVLFPTSLVPSFASPFYFSETELSARDW